MSAGDAGGVRPVGRTADPTPADDTRTAAAKRASKAIARSAAAVDTAFLRGGTGRSDETDAPRFDPQAYGRTIPLGRIARPQDIVGPTLFLLSEAACYVTGQTLQVNGGAFMS